MLQSTRLPHRFRLLWPAGNCESWSRKEHRYTWLYHQYLCGWFEKLVDHLFIYRLIEFRFGLLGFTQCQIHTAAWSSYQTYGELVSLCYHEQFFRTRWIIRLNFRRWLIFCFSREQCFRNIWDLVSFLNSFCYRNPFFYFFLLIYELFVYSTRCQLYSVGILRLRR